MNGSMIRMGLAVVAASVVTVLAEEGDSEKEWGFEKCKAGSIPKGWEVAETGGQGKPATWEVVAGGAESAQAVAITTNANQGHTFSLLIAKETSYKDLEIEVVVKAVAGKEDQGGGPIWRAKDADNYYICRWNPLENNIRLYYVKDGHRKQLASAEIKTDISVWHEIEVEHEGNKIEVKLDGKEVIKFEDSTFTEAGRVGLWVKADGQTAFDNFEVSSEDEDEDCDDDADHEDEDEDEDEDHEDDEDKDSDND